MQPLTTRELVLEPLTVAHAPEMMAVLSDAEVYRHLDYGPPPSLDHIETVYRKLEARSSPDGDEAWLNWIVRRPGEPPMGYVQATVLPDRSAWVAYVFASAHWGGGHAGAATSAMLHHLQSAYDVTRFLATVECGNARSLRLLERLGFRFASVDEAAPHGLTPTERLYVRDARNGGRSSHRERVAPAVCPCSTAAREGSSSSPHRRAGES